MNLKTLTLPLALAGAVFAQEPQNTQPIGEATQDPFGVPTLAETHGQLRASGRLYEATFQGGRMEYLPELGMAAPTNQPFSFAFESARRGSAVVHDNASREAQAYGLTASVSRPGSIREQYEVRRDGLKQSFVFGQELGSNGDLVVRGRIETPLPFGGETAEGGLSFVHPEWGGIELGEVVGFDANGAKVIGSMTFDGEMLEMSLPASFVDQAAWPITVDPLVGTVLNASVDGFDARKPDASTNNAGQVLLTFHRQFSLASAAVRAQRLNANGTTNGGILFIQSINYSTNAAVGYNRQTGNWLVAYENRASNLLDQSDIRAVSVLPDGTISNSADVALGAANQHSPDVASDGRGTDNECVIVWAEDLAGLRAAQVTALSTTPLSFGTVNVTANGTDTNPAISQNCGNTTTRCMVAFERGSQVRATWVTINASARGSSVVVASNASNPDCDGDGNSAIVVYQQLENGSATSHDIYARCYNLSTLAASGPGVGLDTNLGSDEIEPAIAWLGPNAVVVYSDQAQPSPFNYDLFGVTIDTELCTRCSSYFGAGRSSSGRQHKPCVTSRLAANPGAGSQTSMFFWLEQEASTGFNGDIYGRRFTALGSGGSKGTIANGCGLGGSLSSPSSVSLGTDLVLNVTGADPGASAGFLLLREPGTGLFNCGICQAVIPAAVLNAPSVVGGNFSFTIPIPCDITLNGGRFDWQGAVLGTSQSPCTLLPSGGFSNVYRTTIGL